MQITHRDSAINLNECRPDEYNWKFYAPRIRSIYTWINTTKLYPQNLMQKHYSKHADEIYIQIYS